MKRNYIGNYFLSIIYFYLDKNFINALVEKANCEKRLH